MKLSDLTIIYKIVTLLLKIHNLFEIFHFVSIFIMLNQNDYDYEYKQYYHGEHPRF